MTRTTWPLEREYVDKLGALLAARDKLHPSCAEMVVLRDECELALCSLSDETLRRIYSAWMQVYLGEFIEEEKDKVLKRLGLDEVTEKVHDFALSATTAIGELMDKPRIARIEQHKNKVTSSASSRQKDAVPEEGERGQGDGAPRQKQQQANAWSARATR